MTLGTEVDLEDIWTSASPEALDRTLRLARKLSQAAAAVVSSSDATGEIVRSVDDPAGILSTTPRDDGTDEPNASLAVPLRLTSGQDIGRLRVVDAHSRDWPPDAENLLTELGACLTREIELMVEVKLEKAAAAERRLLDAVDRTPALIFERRKIDAGRSSYTFFGTRKTQLPGVRKMMEGGAAGDLDFLHRDDRELVRTAVLRSNLEETDLDLTFRVKELDRSIRWLRSQSIVRREPDGSVCWNGFVCDVSDLVTAREEAESARVERDALLDHLGRELRAPVRTLGELAERLSTERRPETVSALADDVRGAARTLLGLLDRALVPAGMTDTGPADPPDRRSTDGPGPMRSRAASEGRSPAPGAGRILLADDLDLNRKLIADMLGLEGHVVDCVADGAQAVKAAREGRYDLILMDMVMPGMDGIAATQTIRKLPAPACHVPIVALTANSSHDQLDDAIKAGMNATLTKPMSVDALNGAVSTWIRSRYEAA